MELSQVLQALRNADAAGDTEAAKRLAQIARQITGGAAAPPETTFLGQTKEAFKGLIPGAVGLVEQAAIGASALLPEEQERVAREAIASTAGALKAPFAPAPGYEETVGRKLGEAVGSTGPFLLAGPLGLAGRLGAVGLGVGAGAGEARTRAEAEGATAEQRGTATALGTLPGALEVFAPFRILSRIPEGEVLDAAARVKRVLTAAGEEAAQEAASGLAQNMIARGVYKPEQELIEGLGEQAAYGGATGAIVQGLMDLALGRRARGTGTAPEVEGEAPIDRLKREAAEKAQAEERARTEPVNQAQAVIDETEGLPIGEAFPRLTQEIETLRQQPKSPERDEAIKALTEERRRRQTEDAGQLIEGKRAAQGFMTAEEAGAAGVVPRGEFDATQAEIEDLTRRRDALLVKGKSPAPKSPARREFDRIETRLGELSVAAPTAPTAATAPTGAEAVPEPTVRGPKPPPEVLDSATIKTIGFTRGKIHDTLVGKSITDPEIRAVLEEYKQRKNASTKTVDKIDAFLGRLPETAPPVPETPAAEAVPTTPAPPVPETPAAEAVTPTETPSATTTEPATGGAGVPVATEPAAVSTPGGAGVVEPTGVVPPAEDVGQPPAGEGEQPGAVAEAPAPPAPAPKPTKLTPQQRADLADEVERISGKMSQDEYDAFVSTHLDVSGSKVKPGAEHVAAAREVVRKYGGDTRYASGVESESPNLDTEQVKALESNDVGQALMLLSADNSADRIHRAVAKRLAPLLDSTDVEIQDQLTDATGDPILGQSQVSGKQIRLSRAGGLSQEVLLHESVHAAAERALLMPEDMLTPQQLAAKRELEALHAAVKKDPDITSADAKGSISEFVAEVMSNSVLQQQLAKKPWRMSDAMKQFKSIILRLIGVKEAQSMLTSAMASVDAIFTPTSEQKVDVSGSRAAVRQELVGKGEEGTLGDWLARTFGARKTIGLRALMMDSLASVEAKLGEAYGEKIRDMMGNMNPVVLLSRALDSVRFAAEMLNVGKMVVDPSGMTRLTTLSHNGKNISYASVMRDIKAEAERRGMTGEALVGEIGEVLAGRREYELMRTPDAASLEFFLTPQEAQAANNRFNNDAFIKGVSENLDAIRFAGIDFLVATGRIPESKAQEWKDATGYIPFKRIDEMDKLYADRGGGVPSDLKLAAFKGMGKFTGSDARQTENPLENFVSLMEWMTREGMKAEAVGRALNDMVLIGAARRLPNPQDVADNQKGAVVSSWENGQQKFYLVPDPADLAAFAGFKAGSVAGPIKAMQQVSKVLRIGVTATPAFAVKQVFDDITRAYVHSGVKNPAALIPRMMLEMPKAWWAEVRGLRTPGMEMLARHGVVPTYDTIEGGNVRNIFEETGISKRSMSKAILRIIEAGAKASDIATRQAIFDQTMKETGDVDLAEQRAREIINFSRKGASSTADFFIRTVPFFNAYARSMDKLLLAAAGNPAMQKTLGMSTGYARNLFFKRMGVLTAAGLAYAMLMSDDEDYQDLSDNVRDRNWVLPYGKELGFTPVIPLPAELAFFFKAIPERVVQYYKLQGTPEERDALRVAKEMLLAGVDLFSTPNLTPQLVKPFLENLVNYSFFLGRPLESQAQLALDPSKRYGTSTSEAIKAGTAALSEAGIEISPIMVENAVRGVLGMSAGLAISVADALVNPSRTDRPLHQQIIPQLTGASALMKDPVGNRFLDDIYDLDKKVEQAYNTYKKEEKDDPEKANEYYLKTFGLQSIREEMKDVMKAVRDMNAQARAIDKMTDIPSEERAQLIADLKSQQNELARISYALRRRAALAQMEVDRQ